MSPETIVAGASKPDFNRKGIPFGGYTMVYIGTENNMNSRTVPAISLNESNDVNGQYFMSKRDGDIKGRTCANGAKQCRYVKAGEIAYSPTVSLVSILTT